MEDKAIFGKLINLLGKYKYRLNIHTMRKFCSRKMITEDIEYVNQNVFNSYIRGENGLCVDESVGHFPKALSVDVDKEGRAVKVVEKNNCRYFVYDKYGDWKREIYVSDDIIVSVFIFKGRYSLEYTTRISPDYKMEMIEIRHEFSTYIVNYQFRVVNNKYFLIQSRDAYYFDEYDDSYSYYIWDRYDSEGKFIERVKMRDA